MSDEIVGTADRLSPHELIDLPAENARRALEFCDRALDLMYEEQRAGRINGELQDAVCAVEAIRTELMQARG